MAGDMSGAGGGMDRSSAARLILDALVRRFAIQFQSAASEAERAHIRAEAENQFRLAAEQYKFPPRLYSVWVSKCLEQGRFLDLRDTAMEFGQLAGETTDAQLAQEIFDWLLQRLQDASGGAQGP